MGKGIYIKRDFFDMITGLTKIKDGRKISTGLNNPVEILRILFFINPVNPVLGPGRSYGPEGNPVKNILFSGNSSGPRSALGR